MLSKDVQICPTKILKKKEKGLQNKPFTRKNQEMGPQNKSSPKNILQENGLQNKPSPKKDPRAGFP